ncbi:hypothetical protein BD309DRAFT_660416 [Dichomitus squalens]|nr:hypothetical protein BD309DRAFT_660416 [Dichomitus squalens]
MESEFILSQVKSLKSVVATNLKQVHNKRVTMENVCLHPELVMHQVDALEEVMRDSILLCESGGNRDKFLITNIEFSLDQLAKVRTALEDSAKLQNAPHDSNIKLTTMGPSFVLGVVKTLEEVIRNNSAEMQANTDLRKLCMSQPVFVTKMVGWFHRLMYAHVSLLAQFATLHDTHALGNDALVESKQEVERLASIEKTAAARIAELEASLEKFHEDNVLAKEAEGTAKVRMNKVASQLESLQSVHFGCERKLEERDGEILQLKEECKKLIQMHREAADVALSAAQKAVVRNDELKPLQSERDQLFAELTQLKASFETFQHSHAQEHDHIMAEVSDYMPHGCVS